MSPPEDQECRALADTDVDRALAMLRVELYAAMQRLEGEHLATFWELIREVSLSDPGEDVGP